jgi:predicted ATPase
MTYRYVVTGAPGTGKTSIVLALHDRGYAVVAESVTDVIAEQQAQGIAEPWQHEGFIDAIVDLQRHRQRLAVPKCARVQVFDRSPLCTLALARFLGRPITPRLSDAVARMCADKTYMNSVFLVRPMGFVEPTAARRISYAESLRFETVHEVAYQEHGFTSIDVPPGPIEDRATLIDRHITAESLGSDLLRCT